MGRLEIISSNNRRNRARDLVVLLWLAGVVASLAIATIHAELVARMH